MKTSESFPSDSTNTGTAINTSISSGYQSNGPPPPPLIAPGHGGLIKEVNPNDVLCGRGGRINAHSGNVRFRDIVNEKKHEYLSKKTKKLDKAHIAAKIVSQIRELDPPGRFLKVDANSGLWTDIGDEKARKKAGQALREDAPDIRTKLNKAEEEEKKQKDTRAMLEAISKAGLVYGISPLSSGLNYSFSTNNANSAVNPGISSSSSVFNGMMNAALPIFPQQQDSTKQMFSQSLTGSHNGFFPNQSQTLSQNLNSFKDNFANPSNNASNAVSFRQLSQASKGSSNINSGMSVNSDSTSISDAYTVDSNIFSVSSKATNETKLLNEDSFNTDSSEESKTKGNTQTDTQQSHEENKLFNQNNTFSTLNTIHNASSNTVESNAWNINENYRDMGNDSDDNDDQMTRESDAMSWVEKERSETRLKSQETMKNSGSGSNEWSTDQNGHWMPTNEKQRDNHDDNDTMASVETSVESCTSLLSQTQMSQPNRQVDNSMPPPQARTKPPKQSPSNSNEKQNDWKAQALRLKAWEQKRNQMVADYMMDAVSENGQSNLPSVSEEGAFGLSSRSLEEIVTLGSLGSNNTFSVDESEFKAMGNGSINAFSSNGAESSSRSTRDLSLSSSQHKNEFRRAAMMRMSGKHGRSGKVRKPSTSTRTGFSESDGSSASWMKNYVNMQSISSDINPWINESNR